MRKLWLSLFLICVLHITASCSEDSVVAGLPPFIIPEDSIERETMEEDSVVVPNRTVNIDSISISLFADNSYKNQSAAVYGDYMFLVTKGRGRIYIYNLKEKSLVYTIKLPASSEYDYLGSDLYHSNQASFGIDFYAYDDPFPLLYISQRARSDLRCFVEVFRIVPVLNESGDGYKSIDAQLVQTVFFPAMTQDNSLGNVNCVIDSEKRLMYTYSRNNNKEEDNYGECKVSCFNIPPIGQNYVYLEDRDILSSFMLGCSAVNMQGGCIKDGVLYIGQGYKSAGYIYLNVVDLYNNSLLGRIDLLNQGVKWEPEGCFYYHGKVMIAADNNIWEISNIIKTFYL